MRCGGFPRRGSGCAGGAAFGSAAGRDCEWTSGVPEDAGPLLDWFGAGVFVFEPLVALCWPAMNITSATPPSTSTAMTAAAPTLRVAVHPASAKRTASTATAGIECDSIADASGRATQPAAWTQSHACVARTRSQRGASRLSPRAPRAIPIRCAWQPTSRRAARADHSGQDRRLVRSYQPSA